MAFNFEEDFSGDYFDARDELKDIEMAIEEAEDIISGSEEIADRMKKDLEEGTLDAITARFMALALDIRLKSIGGSKIMSLPALESFDEDNEVAVTYSLENLNSIIDNLKANIIEFIKMIGKAIRKIYEQHIALVGRTNKKAKAIVKRLETGDYKAIDSEISISGTDSDNIFGANSKSNVNSYYNERLGLKAMGLLKDTKPFGAELPKYMKALVDYTAYTDTFGNLVTAAEDFYESVITIYGLSRTKEPSSYRVKYQTPSPVIGSFILNASFTEDRKFGLTIDDFFHSKFSDKTPERVKIKALSNKDTLVLANDIIRITGAIMDAKVNDKTEEKIRRDIAKHTQAMREGEVDNLVLRKVLKDFSKLARILHKPKYVTLDALETCSRSALNICVASLKNLEKEDK